jgi:two-component system response regulator
MSNDQSACPIFVVDDDQDDWFLVKKALRDSGVKNETLFLKDGQFLMDNLGVGSIPIDPNEKRELPCLILLDLNMPRLDGRETLKLLKSNEKLRSIPVVILTNSRNPEDIRAAYQEGAASFFTKPSDYKEMVTMMSLINRYWFQTAQLPNT